MEKHFKSILARWLESILLKQNKGRFFWMILPHKREDAKGIASPGIIMKKLYCKQETVLSGFLSCLIIVYGREMSKSLWGFEKYLKVL